MHIGSPKAGSTSIQQALLHNSDMLEESGIKYFAEERSLSTLYGNHSVLPPGKLRINFDSVESAERWSEDRWQVFENLTREQNSDYMLISDESFSSIKPVKKLLDRLKSLFSELHVIAYIRDPVSMFTSSVNQRIRSGARLPSFFLPWTFTHPMPFVTALERYRKQVGESNLTVRNFDRNNLYRNDVVEDFFQVLRSITGQNLTSATSEQPSNESISGTATAWLLILNEALAEKGAGLVGKEKSLNRKKLLDRIREFERGHQLPKLKLVDEVIINSILHHARPLCLSANQQYLSEQVNLEVGEELDSPPSPQELRERTRDWIMSYMDRDAALALSSGLLDLK